MRADSAKRAARTPGGANGIPARSYSRRAKPAPRPSSKRPPERSASAAASRARTTGWRKSLFRTRGPTRTRSVAPATIAQAVSGAIAPATRWSPTVIEANPSDSTRAASARSARASRSHRCTPIVGLVAVRIAASADPGGLVSPDPWRTTASLRRRVL